MPRRDGGVRAVAVPTKMVEVSEREAKRGVAMVESFFDQGLLEAPHANRDHKTAGGPQRKRPNRKALTADKPPAAENEWIAAAANISILLRLGIKPQGGGAHQSKTMMLAELTAFLSAGVEDRPLDAILRDNLLGKPSIVARRAALYRLRQLYGIGDDAPICLVLHRLWPRDPAGQAMLALLCALARDPPLRDGAAAVLDALPGEPVRWPAFAAAFAARHPGRLGEKMAKSLAQNAASSWTQAGFLKGAVRKERIRAQATPAVAAYAALLAGLCGFGGRRVLECRWLDLLDCPVEDRLALLRRAEGHGLARVREVGDVLEIDVAHPIARTLEVPELGQR
jgi:hypothetical protein